jgi:hypothetical protein
MQGHAFAGRAVGRHLGWQPGLVTEREVDQHDEAQPARVRGEHVGHRARDEPVEEHVGAVRHGCKAPTQLSARHRVGLRPRAAHGDLAHGPARGG